MARPLQVRLSLCLLFLVLLSSCGRAPGSGAGATPGGTATPPGQITVPTPVLTPPPGWSAILPGLQFANASTLGGLAASAARPGRVIGCGMRVPINQPAVPPAFELSDDGGKTWQARAIPNEPPAQGCLVFADTLQADTFVLLPDVLGSPLFYTRDAGASWQTLGPPPGGVAPRPVGLVGGQLFGVAQPSGASAWQLMRASLAAGTWQTLNRALPHSEYIPLVAAVDPEDPARLYVDGVVGSVLTVYRSTDSGASWSAVAALPTAHHLALYTAHHHQVFAEQLDGKDTDHPLVYSADGGTTWQGVSLHIKTGGEQLWMTPQGQIITETEVDAWNRTLYRLDPVHSAFTTIGTYTLGQGPVVAAVVDGTVPALLYATPDHTWRLPLGG